MKLNIKSTVIVLLLTTCLLASQAAAVFAGMETSNFKGSDCTDNETAAAAIDYVMTKHEHKQRFGEPGQCWGYAERVKNTMSDETKTSYYKGLRFTKSSFKDKCLGIKAGTHIRFSHGSTFNGGSGHSVSLLKVSEKQVIWADNNYSWDNTVCYYKGSLNDFYNCYGQYEYINMVSKPVSYKTYTSPKLAVAGKSKKAELSWMKVKKADFYKVYRAYSKSGDYKLISETENTGFIDKEAKTDRKVYYKVKAVWEDGGKYSAAESCNL